MLADNNRRIVWFLIIALMYLSHGSFVMVSAQQPKRPFTVADDIELATFGGSSSSDEGLLFSPDGKYFVVETGRGRPGMNDVEDSLRFYRSQDIEDFLKRPSESQAPGPIWVVSRSTYKSRTIKGWRWLPNSIGAAFLERVSGDNYRLVLADLRKKTIERLTSPIEEVSDFDVRDRQNYVYTRPDPAERANVSAEREGSAIVGTGRPLFQLLLPNDLVAQRISSPDAHLWAVVGGKRFEVKQDGMAVIPDPFAGIALSPDGGSVVTAVPVSDVPRSWETLYPPPFASDPNRIHAGRQTREWARAYWYVRVNLRTGSVQSLTEAPLSNHAGSWAFAFGGPSWSSDGQAVLLPGTFIKSQENIPSRPCVAMVDLVTNTRACVEMLKGHAETGTEEGFHDIQEVRFAGEDRQRILVRFRPHGDLYSIRTNEYRRTTDNGWQVVGESDGDVSRGGFEVTVKEGLNEPPLLIASSERTSRVIWDPNPHLKGVDLGQASVYKWTDKQGREWRGGLFKPTDYKSGQRYPLVIQTHGFSESKFIPSGIFPTAFAARALASEGILVLQVADLEVCLTQTTYEGPCAVSGYEAAANKLISDRVVDPEKIGIVGWSRTCFYVIQTLAFGSLRLKAASITDGFMEDYLQYLLETDWTSKDFNAVIGAEPFGEGLQQWLKRSPGFNLDKTNSPLMVVGAGPLGVLHMWLPYAGLRYLHKPVDLIMLNTDEHVLTNPAARMASQGGTVDWFRFWLQDYEDPDPTKAEQYIRWRELRKLQRENEAKAKPANERPAPVN